MNREYDRFGTAAMGLVFLGLAAAFAISMLVLFWLLGSQAVTSM